MSFLSWTEPPVRLSGAARSAAAAIVLFLFVTPFSATAEITYYRANSLGMRLGSLGAGSKNNGFVLSVDARPESETRILLEDGKEIQRWAVEKLKDGRLKTTVSDPTGVLSVEYADESGRLLAEDRYLHGTVVEKAAYVYRNSILKSVSVTDANGTFLYEDAYERSSDGRLRRILRTHADGSVKKSSFGFAGERLREELTNANGTAEYIRYDRTGNIESKEEWKGKTLVSRETFRYEAGKLASSVIRSENDKLLVTKNYSPEGHVTLEKRERDGRLERTLTRDYSDGRLTREHSRTKDLEEERTYTYGEDGLLLTEKYLKNGVPEKMITHLDKSTYQEELFRNGAVFMRVMYRDGKKVAEEFVRNGETVRTRKSEAR